MLGEPRRRPREPEQNIDRRTQVPQGALLSERPAQLADRKELYSHTANGPQAAVPLHS